MNILKQIDEWIREERIVGFCPWRDGKALLFGVPKSRNGKTITFQLISPLGKDDGKEKYSLDRISYFDLDEVYCLRLRLLAKFRESKPDSTQYSRRHERIDELLERAVLSKEVIYLRLISESSSTAARIIAVNDDWIDFEGYDDLMSVNARKTIRRDLIRSLRAGTAYEEADKFLLARKRQKSKAK